MNSLKIAFFTEAGRKRGMGHLIRCYTIYQEFKDNKIFANFFLDSDIDFNYKFDDLNYFSWEKFSLDYEEYDIVFIDSYEADLKIYEEISQKSKIAIYIDDFKRLEYPTGVIINFAPDSEKLFYKEKKDNHIYLLGMDFLPIRKEFLQNKILKENQIFIMLGGSDSKNLSFSIVEALDSINIKKILVVNNKDEAQKIERLKNIEVLYKPNDSLLVEKMKRSKLAITTASMSLYELSFLKIPTVIISVSKNQEIGANQAIKYNIANFLVNIEKLDWQSDINTVVNFLLKNSVSKNSKIDGFGTKRVFETVKKLVVK